MRKSYFALMKDDGAIAIELKAIQNSFNYKDLCCYVKYDDLVSNTEQCINDVYKFLNIPSFQHKFCD